MMIPEQTIRDFQAESNKIESIVTTTVKEVAALREFLDTPIIGVRDMEKYVSVVQPKAFLRDKPGLDVWVGHHKPPRGGPDIRDGLKELLERVHTSVINAHDTHCVYETLHPFMDGNGRSGRALWAWQMIRSGYNLEQGFLHIWYYQTLSALDARKILET